MERIINIKIFKSGKIDMDTKHWGVQNEKNITKLLFTFPEELESYNKEILFDFGMNQVVTDLITNNEYTVDNNVSCHTNIDVAVRVTKQDGTKLFESLPESIMFGESLEPTEDMPTPEEVSKFNTMVNTLNEKIEEVENVDISAEKTGDTATIIVTKKDGTQDIVEIYDGVGSTGGTSTEKDPTVPEHVKNITEEDIEKWNNTEIPETLYALGADYAEYFEWEDGNPNNEDRTSLFVSIVYGTRKIRKSVEGEDILGITSIDASIIGNAKYKDEKTYSAVGMTGVMRVRDNGISQVGDYVVPGDNGIAIPSKNDAGYKVTARYSDNLIEVLMAHDSEMISRIKAELSELDKELDNFSKTIPTKTSELQNDSNFVSDNNYIHTDNNYTTEEKEKLSNLSNYDDTEIKEELKSKLSEEQDPTVPQYVKNISEQDISNWNGKADTGDIPNVSDFITKDVSNLTYYYTKTDINNLVGDIETLLGGI